jgi:hypothetical protein
MRLLVLLFFFSIPAFAAIENPYLFEVRNGERISWILGTQHVGIDLSELIVFVEPRLRSSRIAFWELVPDEERIHLWSTDPAKALATSDQFDWSKGASLAPETRESLKINLGIPDVLLEKLTSESCRAVTIYDVNRVPRLSLDYQLSILAGILRVEQRALDTAELRARAEEADRTGRFASVWKCDMDALARQKSRLDEIVPRLLAAYRSGFGHPAENLPMEGIALRNRAWLKTLEPEMKIGGVFVGVGAAHLYGPNGLIALLRARGFAVTRFPHPDED